VQSESVEGRVQSKFKRVLRSVLRTMGVIIVVAVIFTFGVGVGNGAIQFGQLKNTQNKDLPADLDYSSVESLYDTLKAGYDGNLDVDKLLDGMKSGLAEASGDHYTVYLNAKDADEFNKQLNGTFSGIGAELGEDADKNLIIVSPISGFPAAKAGLRPQDLIVEINGKSTAGLNIAEAVTKIRGPKGTKVNLRILRDKQQDLKFTITRQDIKIASVKYEILSGNIGYMQISQFSDDTTELAQKAANEFKKKGVKGVVLDLRGNPGGLLTAAVNVSSLWLEKGVTVLQEKRGGVITGTEVATGTATLLGLPTAVLINEGSASASEIMAGALKDNNVATLFGAKSFGKGSVQQIKELPGGGELKVTVARWYRPNGENIDKKGIVPDKKIELSDDDIKNKRDPQKDAAINFVKSQ
jgi:carboxyl-terminal processing protease